MPRLPARIALTLLAVALPFALHAQDTSATDRSVPYVDVTVEVHGLDESAALLNDAMRRLSNVLSEIAASPEALTPEQLAAFAELAIRTNELVASLDRTLNGLGPAIRDAGAPTREVLTSLLETTKAQAIDPTLAAIDRRVRAWLMLLILGALLVVGTAAAGLYLSTRQLSAAATILRSLGNDYQIVPRPTAAGRAPAGEPADADSETAPPDG